MGFIIIQPPPDGGDGGGTTGPEVAYVEKPLSALTSADSLALYIARTAVLTDAMLAADSFTQQLTIAIELTDQFAMADSQQLTRQLFGELLDEVYVYGLFKTEMRDAAGNLLSDNTQTWVMNTEGARPLSEYSNFQFNSMATHNDQFYGTTDEGLYLIGADNDAGANITSELASLMLDFGTSRQKRIRTAYLGYTSDDTIVLKVRAVSSGQLTEHWYTATPVAPDAPQHGFVRVGQGLRSRYWQFELTNANGGDFEIDQLELYPLMLNRRV